MNQELLIVLALLLVALFLFIRNKPRMDVVGLLILLILPLTGILTLEETLAGFSNPSVLVIAALFVISESLVRTGIANQLGDWLMRTAASSEAKLLVLLMLLVAGLGSVMSSTGIVAIFIPVALSLAKQLNIHPSRLLMPLSFAGLISGMQTLVATPPNMVVHAELQAAGYEGFTFLAFTPLGVVVLVMGILYMLVARRWLVNPNKTAAPNEARLGLTDLIFAYKLNGRKKRLKVLATSKLIETPLNELNLRKEFGINLLAIERRQGFRRLVLGATGSSIIRAGDTLLVTLVDDKASFVSDYQHLGLEEIYKPSSYFKDHRQLLGLAEVMLPPGSSLVGKTIQEIGFRTHRKLNVVGLKRGQEAFEGVLVDEKLKEGDILLVAGNWERIKDLHLKGRDFLVLSLPAEISLIAPAANQAPFALLSLAIMVVLMVTGIVPNFIAVLIACLLMGLFKCIDLDTAYKSIHWQSIILIVGILPFAAALQKTGGINLAVDWLMHTFNNLNPRALLAVLFVATSLVGLFISNTATAALMAPVGIALAQAMGLSAAPFAMTVAFAASAAFMTPVSSPVNTLVVAPGQFTFGDFFKIGVPFTLLVLLVSVALIPLMFPF